MKNANCDSSKKHRSQDKGGHFCKQLENCKSRSGLSSNFTSTVVQCPKMSRSKHFPIEPLFPSTPNFWLRVETHFSLMPFCCHVTA
jgi:hypothetical protein